MPNIKWIGILDGETSKYQTGDLDTRAKKMIMPTTIKEMMIKAIPFAIISCFVVILSMFTKRHLAQQGVADHIFIVTGLVAGFLGLLLHELLHAIVYPSKATVYIGIYPKAFAAVALASYPLKRKRFILMSLLPMILGIVPLVIFWISPIEFKAWNGFWFGCSVIGLISSYPDCYNVYQVLKQTPKGCSIQFWGDDTYWIA